MTKLQSEYIIQLLIMVIAISTPQQGSTASKSEQNSENACFSPYLFGVMYLGGAVGLTLGKHHSDFIPKNGIQSPGLCKQLWWQNHLQIVSSTDSPGDRTMMIELSTLVTELSRTAPSRKAARLPKIRVKRNGTMMHVICEFTQATPSWVDSEQKGCSWGCSPLRVCMSTVYSI